MLSVVAPRYFADIISLIGEFSIIRVQNWILFVFYSWTTSKATRTLKFLKRNLSNCSTEVKAVAYDSMVCPTMEYAAVWDSHYVGDIRALEKVQ